MGVETFEYVIVGAGSAGCVLANRLSADPGTRVCLLEAGPPDWLPWIHMPAGFIKTFYHPKVNWLYSMEPSDWTGGRRIHAPRGKTLGGSSSINGHVYNRGQRLDFDTWSQMGNRGWGYADVLPYFKRLENRGGKGDATYRGRSGNLDVRIRSNRTNKMKKVFDYKDAVKKIKNYKSKDKVVDLDCDAMNIVIRGDVKIVFWDYDRMSPPDKAPVCSWPHQTWMNCFSSVNESTSSAAAPPASPSTGPPSPAPK